MLSTSADYRIDEATGVLVRKDGRSIDYADGGEPYVEKVLSEADRVSAYPVELRHRIKDWASEYHLSHQRVNLLDAVADVFDADDRVLEIGAGLGILTRWMADRCGAIDAVEGSLQRAKVNRIRTRDEENVSVIMDDMTTMQVPKGSYDIVTLTGVLEYAPVGSDQDPWAACLSVLEMTRDAITDDGALVLAIENRLGVRYWAGCREDHTGAFYEGVLGYPNPGTPITWSRNELETMLREAGYEHLQFFHLFPDYKLPTLFMRECPELAEVGAHAWAQDVVRDYMGERRYFLPDPLVFETLANAGLLSHFSNSFLVLASPTDRRNLETPWVVRKYWNKLASEFHHTISLVEHEGSMAVERRPIYQGIDRLDHGSLHFRLRDQEYSYGRLLYFDALRALFSSDPQARLVEVLREVKDGLVAEHGTGKRDPAGYEVVAGESLDYAFWNLTRSDDGSLVSVDSKWSTDEEITEDYIVYRNLFHLFTRVKGFADPAKVGGLVVQAMSELYDGFDESRLRQYAGLESAFQRLAIDGPSGSST